MRGTFACGTKKLLLVIRPSPPLPSIAQPTFERQVWKVPILAGVNCQHTQRDVDSFILLKIKRRVA
jgi:hypothetical protein